MRYRPEAFVLPATPAEACDDASQQPRQGQSQTSQREPGRALVIGLIDHYRLSRECVARALQSLNPSDILLTYIIPQGCISADRNDFDLLIYYLHGDKTPQASTLSNLAALHRMYPSVPLVVLSDVEDALQTEVSHEMLKVGASSFIATRTTGIFLTIGATRFLKEGGNLTAADWQRPAPGVGPQPQLTSREMAVLRLMQRGKANKIIAHELSVSENTVKIHVRNVMRKLDATNRTQAVDKARKLWGSSARETASATERPAWCRRKLGDRRIDRRQRASAEDE